MAKVQAVFIAFINGSNSNINLISAVFREVKVRKQ
jgi:hypothetical protein